MAKRAEVIQLPPKTAANVTKLNLARNRTKPLSLNAMDTIRCLREMMEMAQRGEVEGLVFALERTGREIITDSAGSCHANPRWARALVRDIEDYLKQRLESIDETV